MIGTPLYVPPEHVENGGLRQEPHTDVYSLAVTLYEILTLSRAFDGATQREIFENILRATPTKIRKLNDSIPRELETVLSTAMDRDPARRYASAADFADDLERVVAREPILARPLGAWLRLHRWVQRNPWAAGLLALFAVAATLSTLLLLDAQRANRRFNLLAYEPRLQKVLESEAWELPAREAKLPTLRGWLDERAKPLLAELDGLRKALADTRSKALPYSEAQRRRDERRLPKLRELKARERELALRQQGLARLPAQTAGEAVILSQRRGAFEREIRRLGGVLATLRSHEDELRSYEFAHDADRFVHDGLQQLIAKLHGLEKRLVPRVEEQIDWAQRVAAESIEGPHLALWNEAIRAIRLSDGVAAHSDYRQLRLRPQLGLVPVGMDPDSKLWEFAQVRSGSVPRRAANGRLDLEDDHAIIFVLIPGGRFAMGAPKADAERYYVADQDEHPRHEVELDAFFIAKHEMTQSQWRALEWKSLQASTRSAEGTARTRSGIATPSRRLVGMTPCASFRAMSSVFQPKRSGSTRRAVASMHPGTRASTCEASKGMPTSATQATPGSTLDGSRRSGSTTGTAFTHRLVASSATRSACTTCTATWPSGARIGTHQIPIDGPRGQATACVSSTTASATSAAFAAAASTTALVLLAAFIAMAMGLTRRPPAAASDLPGESWHRTERRSKVRTPAAKLRDTHATKRPGQEDSEAQSDATGWRAT